MNSEVISSTCEDIRQEVAMDLDNFIEHESIRVRCMEEMGQLASKMENKTDAIDKKREEDIKKLALIINNLDCQDKKRVEKLLVWASGTEDSKLIAQLMALKARHDCDIKTSKGILDVQSLRTGLKKRISRGVGTLMLCGVIAMGVVSAGPDRISIVSSDSMSNREEVTQISNISTLLHLRRKG